jgi:hypothetical protein
MVSLGYWLVAALNRADFTVIPGDPSLEYHSTIVTLGTS